MSNQAKIKRQIRKAELEADKYNSTSHVLHLLLSIITAGIWIPVWILISISNSVEKRRALSRIEKLENQLT